MIYGTTGRIVLEGNRHDATKHKLARKKRVVQVVEGGMGRRKRCKPIGEFGTVTSSELTKTIRKSHDSMIYVISGSEK